MECKSKQSSVSNLKTVNSTFKTNNYKRVKSKIKYRRSSNINLTLCLRCKDSINSNHYKINFSINNNSNPNTMGKSCRTTSSRCLLTLSRINSSCSIPIQQGQLLGAQVENLKHVQQVVMKFIKMMYSIPIIPI